MSARTNKKMPSGKKIIAKKRMLENEKIVRKQKKESLIRHGFRVLNDVFSVRVKNKLAAIFKEIDEYEKTAEKLVKQTAKAYYNAGNILADKIREIPVFGKALTVKEIADASELSERRVTLSLKIFKHFENNPDALNGLTLRDSLKLIAPPPAAGVEGYNRVDLGGNAGQINFDFGDLFEMPSTVNSSLQTYRTMIEKLSEIVVVKRANDGSLISKRFAHFGEDIPQDPDLLRAYKTMSEKTQAAIEDYLAALEQEEVRG